MKLTTNILVYVLALLGVIGIGSGVYYAYNVEKEKAEVVKIAEPVPEPVDPTLVTRDFVTKVLIRCQAKLSDTKRAILTDQLVRVTHQRFEKEENRQAYLALLCIESGYNQSAKSPVGATGVAQIMPKFAADFARLCGYKDIDPNDILDTEVNIQIGACLFRHLIEETGNVYIGMAAYNSGLGGTTTKNLKALKGGGPPETINYVNKIAVLKEEIRNASDTTDRSDDNRKSK